MHEPSRSVSGVVRDPAGQPLPGAWVVFGDRHGGLEAETDAAGCYRLDDLLNDCAGLTVAAAGYEPTTVRVEVPADGIARRDVVLEPGGEEFAGTVTDETGTPLAGIEVHWHPGGWSDLSMSFRTTHTDEAGRFRLRGVPAGRHSVQASDPFRTFTRSRDADAGTMDLEFRLRPAGVLAGRVESPHARPEPEPGEVRGVVIVRPADRRDREHSHSLRGAIFRMEHLEPGEYDVQARIPGLGSGDTERVTVRAGGETFLTLGLAGGLELSGRTVAAEDGAPLEGARVVAIEMTMPVNALLFSEPERIRAAGGSTVLADEGGGFRLTGLTETRHRVAAHHPGRIPVLRDSVPMPPDEKLELALPRAGTLRIEMEGSDPTGGLRFRYPNGALRHSFEPEGARIVLDDLPTAAYEVMILKESVHYRARPVVREGETTRIVLAPPPGGATLIGRVEFAKDWIRSGHVLAWWESGGVTYARSGRIADDGAFAISGLPDRPVELTPDFGSDPLWPRRVPGIEVEPGGSPVTLPVDGVELRLVDHASGEAVVPFGSDLNRVLIPVTPAGREEVTYGRFRHHPVRVISPSTEEPNEVRVRVAERAWIGAVDPDGRALSGADVRVLDATGWDLTEVARVRGQCPPFEGHSSFSLAPGEYRVLVSHPDYETIETRLTMEDRMFSGSVRLGRA